VPEQVTGSRLSFSEEATQIADIVVEQFACGCWWVVIPDPVDQLLRWDRPSASRQQHGEHKPLLGDAQMNELSTRVCLCTAQQAKLQHASLCAAIGYSI
jgi:hypothetical protein